MQSLNRLSSVLPVLLASVTLCGCGSSTTSQPSPSGPSTTSIDLLPDPGMHNPVLQFGNGGVANNQGTLFPGTSPAMGYTDFGWWVTQWGKFSSDTPPIPYYLTPDSYVQSDASTQDPNFGVASLAFYSENDPTISHLALYQDQALKNWVYELWSQDGLLSAGGGTNLFLSNTVNSPSGSSLSADVHLTFATKIKQRVLSFNDAAAMTDGSVLAMYFTGLTLNYTDPATGNQYWQFLQIPHANTMENTNTDAQCISLGSGGIPDVMWSGVLPGGTFLSSTPSTGALQSLDYDVNKYVCALVKAAYNCGTGTVNFPTAAYDLRNWQITSLYIGLETENRMVPNDQVVRGHAGLGVQIENLHLLKFPANSGPTCTQ
jgi:hypothetical protein